MSIMNIDRNKLIQQLRKVAQQLENGLSRINKWVSMAFTVLIVWPMAMIGALLLFTVIMNQSDMSVPEQIKAEIVGTITDIQQADMGFVNVKHCEPETVMVETGSNVANQCPVTKMPIAEVVGAWMKAIFNVYLTLAICSVMFYFLMLIMARLQQGRHRAKATLSGSSFTKPVYKSDQKL